MGHTVHLPLFLVSPLSCIVMERMEDLELDGKEENLEIYGNKLGLSCAKLRANFS